MFIPLHDANSLTHIRVQYVTLFLIAANVIIWLITGTPALSDNAAITKAYYAYGFVPAVVNGLQQLPAGIDALPTMLSYVSYSFLHADFMHLAGNMLFLWVFGDNVEDALGHFKFLVFYLLSVIAGAWFHGMMAPESGAPLIGASAAAAGIISGYLMLHPNVRVWVLALGRIPLRIPAIWALGAWILFQFYSLASNPEDEVSWAAHIGGIIAGLVLVPIMKRSSVPLFDWGDGSNQPEATELESGETRDDEIGRIEKDVIVPRSEEGLQAATKNAVSKPSGSVPAVNKGSRWGRPDN